jgi:site-specific recombinase
MSSEAQDPGTSMTVIEKLEAIEGRLNRIEVLLTAMTGRQTDMSDQKFGEIMDEWMTALLDKRMQNKFGQSDPE